jgi:hypothetical protein
VPTLLTERFSFTGGKVDRTDPARPYVREVLACGPTSLNRRRYLAQAFEGKRVERYNGIPVKVTLRHGDTNQLYQEQIGVTENARHRASDGMPVVDIAVNPHKTHAEAFLWDAQYQPNACGMSHVAKCETRRAPDGWEEVTELVEACSLDVIGAKGAATTKGLYESTEGRTVPLTVKALCEALVKHPKVTSAQVPNLKFLAEMDGMDAAPSTMEAPPADDADPAAGVTDAFCSACMVLCKQGLDDPTKAKEVLSKLKEMFASHGKVNGKPAGGADDDPTTPESKTVSLRDVVAECKAAKLDNPGVDLVEKLTTVTDKDTRAFFIAEAVKGAKPPGQNPTGTTRRPGAGSAGPALKTEGAPTAPAKAPAVPKWDEM